LAVLGTTRSVQPYEKTTITGALKKAPQSLGQLRKFYYLAFSDRTGIVGAKVEEIRRGIAVRRRIAID